MKFFAATALFAGLVAATSEPVVTTTVTAFTTYCPEATTLTHGSSTIIVTAPTTVTLACPNGCTVTRPVYSTSKVICPSVSASPVSSMIGTAPYKNGTMTATFSMPAPSTSATTTAPITPISSGGADKAMSASGAGLAAALGFAAFFL